MSSTTKTSPFSHKTALPPNRGPSGSPNNPPNARIQLNPNPSTDQATTYEEILGDRRKNPVLRRVNRASEQVQQTGLVVGEIIGESIGFCKKLFGGLGQKILQNPNFASFAGIGGALAAALLALKNGLKTISFFNDPKSQDTSYVFRGIHTVLLGGLASCLGAPFLGLKNPFAKEGENGQAEVPLNSIIGLTVAWLGSGEFIRLVEGTSILGKFPFLGTLLIDIAKMINSGVKSVASPELDNPNPTNQNGLTTGMAA